MRGKRKRKSRNEANCCKIAVLRVFYQIKRDFKWPVERFEVSFCLVLVAHTGFEPVVSALRGRRPRPLDECAMWPRESTLDWEFLHEANNTPLLCTCQARGSYFRRSTRSNLPRNVKLKARRVHASGKCGSVV